MGPGGSHVLPLRGLGELLSIFHQESQKGEQQMARVSSQTRMPAGPGQVCIQPEMRQQRGTGRGGW